MNEPTAVEEIQRPSIPVTGEQVDEMRKTLTCVLCEPQRKFTVTQGLASHLRASHGLRVKFAPPDAGRVKRKYTRRIKTNESTSAPGVPSVQTEEAAVDLNFCPNCGANLFTIAKAFRTMKEVLR